MARLIEFSRRSTVQLQKILEFYDERNGNDAYSRRLLKSLLSDLQYSGAQKCLSPLRPFDCTSDNISVHLQNIYDTDELKKEATTEKISVVASVLQPRCHHQYSGAQKCLSPLRPCRYR